MKRIAAATLAAAAALTIAACSAQEQVDEYTEEVTIELKDGRELPCVYVYNRAGGMSCNWDEAK